MLSDATNFFENGNPLSVFPRGIVAGIGWALSDAANFFENENRVFKKEKRSSPTTSGARTLLVENDEFSV